ncbi:MAG: hypothetical protein JO038_04690 [Alphaproteobacteria bacterium]|nr:hypothetical protein [Alphaproteobacteria bacterium]
MPEVAGDSPRPRVEASDIDVAGLGWLALGLAGIVVAAIALLALLYQGALHLPDARPIALPPEPRLQTDPAADLAHLNANAAARLGSYGYVDRSRGLVHIPIEEAMKRVVDQGIPDWPNRPR